MSVSSTLKHAPSAVEGLELKSACCLAPFDQTLSSSRYRGSHPSGMDGAAVIENNADVSSKGTAQMTIAVRAVVLALASLMTSVCVLRLYLRKFILRRFGLDDFLVILALVAVNGFSALAYTFTYYGLGADIQNVPSQDLLTWFKIYFGAECSYLVVGAIVRISLIVFIMRLFPTKTIRTAGISFMVFIVAFTISMTFALALKCRPFSASYNKTITDAKCWSSDTYFAVVMTQGVIMFVLDVIILVLPFRPTWKLPMDMRERLMVLGLFAVGFIACAAALVRFSTLVYARDGTNFTKSDAWFFIWMEIEFNFGLTAGSLSTLPKLFKLNRYRAQAWARNRSSLAISRYPTRDTARLSSPRSEKSTTTISTKPLSISSEMWIKGIHKKTEIKRVSECMKVFDSSEDNERIRRSGSQERIAPRTPAAVPGDEEEPPSSRGVIYGAGESVTLTRAYSGARKGRDRKGRRSNSRSRSRSRKRREKKKELERRGEYQEFDIGDEP
ncbi:hypothetical protein BDW69DRAFT_164642 [Aspergillus filifer]